MSGKVRGGICVAIGMASERDEALPIRAVKGSSMAAAKIVADAVEHAYQISVQTTERAIEESAKDISEIIAETFGPPPIVGEARVQETGDRCAATGTVSDSSVPRHRPQRLATSPGSWMLSASIVFSRRTRERVFEQIVADFREEYCDALNRSAGRTEFFFLVWRHWAGFILAGVLECVHGVGKILRVWKGTS